MSLKLTQIISVFLISCLLSACASFVAPASPSANNQTMSWAARKAQLAKVRAWQIQGAVAIKTPQQAFTASLNWQQRGFSQYKIYLFGPLGMGAVNLFAQKGNVILHANDKIYKAQSANKLLQEQLGWQLPVNSLYYWVRGLPAPGAVAKIKFDRFHHIVYLSQRGWQIQYMKYTGVNHHDLPSKIYLKNRYMTGKLIISNWKV